MNPDLLGAFLSSSLVKNAKNFLDFNKSKPYYISVKGLSFISLSFLNIVTALFFSGSGHKDIYLSTNMCLLKYMCLEKIFNIKPNLGFLTFC